MDARGKGEFFIGVSGWANGYFRNAFYPNDLHSSEFLKFYSRKLKSVEVNSTFYRFSRKSTFQKWCEETPRGFIFAVKAPRYFTHDHRLGDPDKRMPEFLESLTGFGEKLGPVLFQLPPSLRRDLRKLKGFVKRLPRGYQYAIEFRNKSWYEEKVYDVLEKTGIALVVADLKGVTSPMHAVGSLAYVRLHGPSKLPYRDSYPSEKIEFWRQTVLAWQRSGKDVHVYFDNTMSPAAVLNALDLQSGLLSRDLINSQGFSPETKQPNL